MEKEIRWRSIKRLGWMTWTAILLMGVAYAAPHYVVNSYTDVRPKSVRASNVASQSATSGQALIADGSGGASFGAVSGSTLQQVMTAGAMSTVSKPMILNPSTGPSLEVDSTTNDWAMSVNGMALFNGTQTLLPSGNPIAMSILRTGGASHDNQPVVVINDTSGLRASTDLLLQVQSGGTDKLTVSGGNVTLRGLANASSNFLATDGTGNLIDYTGNPLTSESDPLSLHTSGGSNTMFQSVLANSSAYNVGSSATPFGSMYANNYYLGAVDVLFTSGSNTYLGSAHSVYLSPGGGGSDQIVFSSSNPVNFNGSPFATTVGAAGGAAALPANPVGYLKMQLDGTTYAFPYYNP